jgi:toxin YoeB
MRLAFTERAWREYLSWQEDDPKTLAKINALLKECGRTPFQGTGKPERLRDNMAGWWSRRLAGTSAGLSGRRRCRGCPAVPLPLLRRARPLASSPASSVPQAANHASNSAGSSALKQALQHVAFERLQNHAPIRSPPSATTVGPRLWPIGSLQSPAPALSLTRVQ